MEVQVTMLVCDVCERRDRPARRYTLTAEGAEPAHKDLCVEDAGPIVGVFFGDTIMAPAAEGVSVESLVAAAPSSTAASVPSENVSVEGQPDPAFAPVKKATQRPAAAKRTAARKTTAKKTAAPRKRGLGAKVTTLEEIEAQKRQAKQA